MQNFRKTETRSRLAFLTKIEDIPGGITVAVSDLTQPVVYAGTPVGKDNNGLFHVIKSAKAKAAATNVATDYQVEKGHNFKVGDFFSQKVGAKAYAITAINTDNADYDVISVGTTLGVAIAVDDVFVQASAEAASDTSTLKYEPEALTGTDFDVVPGDNHLVDAWRRATAKLSVIPPVNDTVKAKLSQIIFV